MTKKNHNNLSNPAQLQGVDDEYKFLFKYFIAVT